MDGEGRNRCHVDAAIQPVSLAVRLKSRGGMSAAEKALPASWPVFGEVHLAATAEERSTDWMRKNGN